MLEIKTKAITVVYSESLDRLHNNKQDGNVSSQRPT